MFSYANAVLFSVYVILFTICSCIVYFIMLFYSVQVNLGLHQINISKKVNSSKKKCKYL